MAEVSERQVKKDFLVWELPQQELLQQERVKNCPGKAEGYKNKLMWLCHKETSSPYGWTETKPIFVTFLSGSLWEREAVEGLNMAREMILLSVLAHWVVPLVWCCITMKFFEGREFVFWLLAKAMS